MTRRGWLITVNPTAGTVTQRPIDLPDESLWLRVKRTLRRILRGNRQCSIVAIADPREGGVAA